MNNLGQNNDPRSDRQGHALFVGREAAGSAILDGPER